VTTVQNSRRQLTLFVAEPLASVLDAVRRTLDPVQASLIAAHVTLCREDEIERTSAEALLNQLKSWRMGPITLAFGQLIRFAGHGVLLPCQQGSDEFQRLRRCLLGSQEVREHAAHLTLAHPKNPQSTGNTDSALAVCPNALELQFASVALIEQQGSKPWRLLEEASLGNSAPGVA
jgi:2'-5' RNA ligase